jgi:hypothetical protein
MQQYLLFNQKKGHTMRAKEGLTAETLILKQIDRLK